MTLDTDHMEKVSHHFGLFYESWNGYFEKNGFEHWSQGNVLFIFLCYQAKLKALRNGSKDLLYTSTRFLIKFSCIKPLKISIIISCCLNFVEATTQTWAGPSSTLPLVRKVLYAARQCRASCGCANCRMVLGAVAHCQGAAPDRRATNSQGPVRPSTTPLCVNFC